MSYSGDAAEQVVRMSLEGAEVAAKITGAGAKQVAILSVSYTHLDVYKRQCSSCRYRKQIITMLC